MTKTKLALCCIWPAVFMFANPAMAYIGPGAGIGAIGSALALVGGLFLLIVGFVWYPVKRALTKFKKNSPGEEADLSAETAEPLELEDVPTTPKPE